MKGPVSLALLKLQIYFVPRPGTRTPPIAGRGGSRGCVGGARGSVGRRTNPNGLLAIRGLLEAIRKRRDDKCWFCHSHRRMTRSYVLLHCDNTRLSEAGEHGRPLLREPPVLLTNPKWECCLLRFPEGSGVGRVVENGKDVEEMRAAVWTGGRRRRVSRRSPGQPTAAQFHLFLLHYTFVQEDSQPEMSAQR